MSIKGNTAELLKDIITIFYAPLAQVYKAASIADSLGDLQNFISDLIRTVELAEEGEFLCSPLLYEVLNGNSWERRPSAHCPNFH